MNGEDKEESTIRNSRTVPEKKRTIQQSRAMHLYFVLLGQALNDAGLQINKVMKPGIDIPWDNKGYMIKSLLWIPVQNAMLGKEHTAELTKEEVSKVYDTLNRHLGIRFGTTCPFPSLEAIYEANIDEIEKRTRG